MAIEIKVLDVCFIVFKAVSHTVRRLILQMTTKGAFWSFCGMFVK